MDYYNIINITKYLYFLSLLFLILISSIFIMLALLQLISKRYTDLYQYKIDNFYLSIFFGLNYIILFILFLYGIRIYNVNHVLDPWEVYIDFTILYSYIKDLSIFFQCYLILLCLTIFIIFLLLLIYIQKYLVHHIIILYIFFQFTYMNNIDHITSPFNRILVKLQFIGANDLITYLLKKIVINYFLPIKWQIIRRIVPWYNPYSILDLIVDNKWFPKIVTISPIIIIIYDCIFNGFIISKVFYYLLFYIPLMLLKRITTHMEEDAYYIRKLLWDIYYKEEEGCIYAISEKDKRLLDIYLLNGLRMDVDLGLDREMYIENVIRFIQNYKDRPNTYSNMDNGIDLRITEDNRVFLEVEIEVETGNIIEFWKEKIRETEIKYDIEGEWILLADKRALELHKNYLSYLWINLTVYTLYFISWSYIFCKFYTLPMDGLLTYFPVVLDNIEPFSGLLLPTVDYETE